MTTVLKTAATMDAKTGAVQAAEFVTMLYGVLDPL